MAKEYLVTLTAEEREQLTELVTKGQAAAYKIKHANGLLKVDVNGPNWSDGPAAEAFSCAPRTVFSLRECFVEQGLAAALGRKKPVRPSRPPTFDGEKEARLIQLACSQPPSGHARWTLRLLAAELVALEVVESVAPSTVTRSAGTRTRTHARYCPPQQQTLTHRASSRRQGRSKKESQA